MSASIWNQGFNHAFAVNSEGSLIERWGNPPTDINVVPGTEKKFVPEADVSISRITFNPDNPFYVAYYVSGQAADSNDVVTAWWTGNEWRVYGG